MSYGGFDDRESTTSIRINEDTVYGKERSGFGSSRSRSIDEETTMSEANGSEAGHVPIATYIQDDFRPRQYLSNDERTRWADFHKTRKPSAKKPKWLPNWLKKDAWELDATTIDREAAREAKARRKYREGIGADKAERNGPCSPVWYHKFWKSQLFMAILTFAAFVTSAVLSGVLDHDYLPVFYVRNGKPQYSDAFNMSAFIPAGTGFYFVIHLIQLAKKKFDKNVRRRKVLSSSLGWAVPASLITVVLSALSGLNGVIEITLMAGLVGAGVMLTSAAEKLNTTPHEVLRDLGFSIDHLESLYSQGKSGQEQVKRLEAFAEKRVWEDVTTKVLYYVCGFVCTVVPYVVILISVSNGGLVTAGWVAVIGGAAFMMLDVFLRLFYGLGSWDPQIVRWLHFAVEFSFQAYCVGSLYAGALYTHHDAYMMTQI